MAGMNEPSRPTQSPMLTPSALPAVRVPASPVPMNTWSDAELTAASTVEVGLTEEKDEFEYEMPTTCGAPGLRGVKGLPTTYRVELLPDPNWTSNRFYRAVTPRQP